MNRRNFLKLTASVFVAATTGIPELPVMTGNVYNSGYTLIELVRHSGIDRLTGMADVLCETNNILRDMPIKGEI